MFLLKNLPLVTLPFKLLVTVLGKNALSRKCELTRGSSSREAHFRARAWQRQVWRQCKSALAIFPFFVQHNDRRGNIHGARRGHGRWLNAVKIHCLSTVFYSLLSCNILEKITPAWDAIALKCAFALWKWFINFKMRAVENTLMIWIQWHNKY